MQNESLENPAASAVLQDETAAVGRRLFSASIASGLLVLVLLMGALFVPTTWPLWLTAKLLEMQDFQLAAILFLGAGLAALVKGRKAVAFDLGIRAVALLSLAVLGLCLGGHYLAVQGYDLTRDEQMVRFDAWIFEHGRLVWPLPPEWRSEARALNLMFMYPVAHPAAWISNYLPGNALLHAAMGLLADRAWTNPLMTAVTVPLLWSCARRIWPENREAAVVCLVLLASSGQFLITGMTLYAMPAHLLCNLAWLRLFLNDRRASDLGAIALGGLATGLHQPLFHPMFVTPFLLVLLLERRWQRLALFTVSYLAIGLFWLSWPGYVEAMVAGARTASSAADGDFLDRLREALSVNSGNLPLTCANLLRFLTWQHVLLLPLMLAAWPLVRTNRLAGAFALGMLLPIGVMAVILPWQGNGFGYRYLHPFLGNAVLLGGFGWMNLSALHDRLRASFVAASAVSLGLILPVQVWMAHARYAPYAKASATIDASRADYAIIQSNNGTAYGSVVFNGPDLSNRPIRLSAELIENPSALAKRICRPGVVVAVAGNAFFLPGARYFGVPPEDTADARLPALRVPYEAAGCRIKVLD